MRIEEHDYGDVLTLSVGQGTLHALAAPLLQHRWEGHCYHTISHLGLAGWDTSWRYGPGWGLEEVMARLGRAKGGDMLDLLTTR